MYDIRLWVTLCQINGALCTNLKKTLRRLRWKYSKKLKRIIEAKRTVLKTQRLCVKQHTVQNIDQPLVNVLMASEGWSNDGKRVERINPFKEYLLPQKRPKGVDIHVLFRG